MGSILDLFDFIRANETVIAVCIGFPVLLALVFGGDGPGGAGAPGGDCDCDCDGGGGGGGD